MWPREDWNDNFSCYLPLGGRIVLRRRRRTDLKILRDIIDSFFLYYCTTNLIFDRNVISILAPRYVLHVHVWALRKKNDQIWYGSFPVRCHSDIRISSDRWNNMLEEMSRTRGSSARISGNTLRPALAGLWLLLDLRAPSIFFTQE